MIGFACFARGATILVDDFRDCSTLDGAPATWRAMYPGVYTAASGDYVFQRESDSDSHMLMADAPAVVARDVSLRVQCRLSGQGSNLGVCARNDGFTEQRYLAGIGDDGGAFILRDDGPGGNVILFDHRNTTLAPAMEDVVLQFDVRQEIAPGSPLRRSDPAYREHTRLELRVWRIGEAMPAEPIITAFDANFAHDAGSVGLFANLNADAQAAFRFVDVGTNEPTVDLVQVGDAFDTTHSDMRRVDTYISARAETAPLTHLRLVTTEPVELREEPQVTSTGGDPTAVWSFTSEGNENIVELRPAPSPGRWIQIRFVVTGQDTGHDGEFTIRVAHHPGDIDQNGTVDIRDATAFGERFHEGNSSADLNGDGVVNIRDATTFGDIWRGTETTGAWANSSLPDKP